ncbi:MAG: hypothetical protein PHT12_00410 [Patescibacteria group bacterium]|nr:hypothetical protein [Patescibacteria group bacterium]
MKFTKSAITTAFFAAIAAAPLAASAVCPVCTVAVGAGLGLTRWFGVDDTVTSLWIGALIVSMTAWTVNWLAAKKPRWRFPADFWVWLAGYVAMVFVPLWYEGIVGHPLNSLWGMDKVLLGSAIGGVVFGAMAKAYEIMKARNGGRAHFPFQKVAMPVAPLLALSLVFYVITKH